LPGRSVPGALAAAAGGSSADERVQLDERNCEPACERAAGRRLAGAARSDDREPSAHTQPPAGCIHRDITSGAQNAGGPESSRGAQRRAGAQGSPAVPSASWPRSIDELVAVQEELGRSRPGSWTPGTDPRLGAVFACFARGGSGPGAAGDPAWVAAVSGAGESVVAGEAGAAYEPGLLALRVGILLERAVRGLGESPGVLLVDATGRDHPRRAGLALHLGAVLGLPTVGVTHRPLLASGDWPVDERAATSPLTIGGEVVGYWLRTRRGTRPLAVHAAWRTDPDVAVDIVLRSPRRMRTPDPLRRARRLARTARARG